MNVTVASLIKILVVSAVLMPDTVKLLLNQINLPALIEELLNEAAIELKAGFDGQVLLIQDDTIEAVCKTGS